MSNKLKVKKNQPEIPAAERIEKRLWHYTTTKRLAKIIENRKIKGTSIGVDEKELPAVWLSSNPDFEQAARNETRDRDSDPGRIGATREELFQAGYPPVRIEINRARVRAHDWESYKKLSGISEETAAALEQTGTEKGADPSEWYASFQPVPLAGGCLFPIEIWNGRQWADIETARPGARGKSRRAGEQVSRR